MTQSLPLNSVAAVATALVFREQPPQEEAEGNARALAIRDIVSGRPLHWQQLPRVAVQDKHLVHCLRPGDVVLPSRGDYYRAWLFTGADEPVLPLGQLNIIRPFADLDAGYLTWYLNAAPAQARIASMLTGTSIRALTKASLLSLEIDLPGQHLQQQIAELDRVTRKIGAIRHRLSELDADEIAEVTAKLLQGGAGHA